jgi:hypothetical protein
MGTWGIDLPYIGLPYINPPKPEIIINPNFVAAPDPKPLQPIIDQPTRPKHINYPLLSYPKHKPTNYRSTNAPKTYQLPIIELSKA